MGGSFPLNACIYDRYRRHGHMAALWTRGIPGHPAIRRQVVKYINPFDTASRSNMTHDRLVFDAQRGHG